MSNTALRWVKQHNKLPDDNNVYHIRYHGYKDAAYCESGEWYNANNDNLLPPAFVNDLEYLEEQAVPEQDELWANVAEKFQNWIDDDLDERSAFLVSEELKQTYIISKK